MKAYGMKKEWGDSDHLRKGEGSRIKKATRFWKNKARQASKKLKELV